MTLILSKKMSAAIGIGCCIFRRKRQQKREAKRQADIDELRNQLNRAQCADCKEPFAQCQCRPAAMCSNSATTTTTATANGGSSRKKKDRKKKKKKKAQKEQ